MYKKHYFITDYKMILQAYNNIYSSSLSHSRLPYPFHLYNFLIFTAFFSLSIFVFCMAFINTSDVYKCCLGEAEGTSYYYQNEAEVKVEVPEAADTKKIKKNYIPYLLSLEQAYTSLLSSTAQLSSSLLNWTTAAARMIVQSYRTEDEGKS